MRHVLMTDRERVYLLCADSNDADLRPYLSCPGARSGTHVSAKPQKF